MADMGIMTAGSATTTIYPTCTDEECQHIINDSKSQVLFCDKRSQAARVLRMLPNCPELTLIVVTDSTPHGSPDDVVVTLSDFERVGCAYRQEHPTMLKEVLDTIGPQTLSTIMYTSGTMGEPKGVMLSHDNWVYAASAIDSLGLLTPLDVQYLFLPLAHSFARVMEITAIRMGLPTALDGDNNTIVENLKLIKPTVFAAVPRFFEEIYQHISEITDTKGLFRRFLMQKAISTSSAEGVGGWMADKVLFARVRELFGGNIKFVISGGAPLSAELAQFFEAAGVLILEGFGLTETSAASCVNRPTDYVFGTVGKPLPGTELKISEDGEILIKGRGVTSGYLNLPTETDKLISNGWMHTGDIGTLGSGGNLRITGRKKALIVTSNGKNIAPARIEQLIMTTCPLIEHAVVFGDERPYCIALLTLKNSGGLPLTSEHQSALYEQVEQTMEIVNSKLARYENIRRFTILPAPFEVSNGTLTPTLKVKRVEVFERHQTLIDTLYDGPSVASELSSIIAESKSAI